jgi:hypothetical protein
VDARDWENASPSMFDESALRRFHKDASDAGFVVGPEEFSLFRSPIVGVTRSAGDQPCNRSSSDTAR